MDWETCVWCFLFAYISKQHVKQYFEYVFYYKILVWHVLQWFPCCSLNKKDSHHFDFAENIFKCISLLKLLYFEVFIIFVLKDPINNSFHAASGNDIWPKEERNIHVRWRDLIILKYDIKHATFWYVVGRVRKATPCMPFTFLGEFKQT